MNARFAPKRALCLLTFVAFGVISASAFPQSTDYRQGYDQGYRDGMAAAQSGPGQPVGRMERIIIEHARYGTRDASCDARDTIQQIAGRRRHVEFKVNNDLCGDPAKGRPKHLEIRYRCGDGPEQRIEMREDGMMSLYCR